MSGNPLVHNASLCPEIGYFYEGNDIEAGAAQLLAAIDTHDAQAEAYALRQQAALARFRPGHADITARYTALLGELFAAQ